MPRTPALLVAAAAILFGTTGTAQALGPAAPPAVVGAARIAVGGALLLAYALATRAFVRHGRGLGAPVVAALGVAGYQVSFFSSVDRTGVALGTVVALGSAPALTGLMSWVALRARPGRRWAVATALATGGSALLVVSGERVGVDPLGVLLALAAGASYALYTLAAKVQLERGRAPAAVMATAFGLGALLLLPLLALAENGWLARPGGLALALYLGVFPTAVAYVLFARGLRELPAPTVATLTLAEPLAAASLGVAVLGERPSAPAALGALLVLSGLVALAVRPPGRGAAT